MPLLAAVLLAGCSETGGTHEDRVGRLLVAPGKYTFYNCAQLAQAAEALRSREVELTALIAKAGPGAGGTMVSAVAYRPEYYQLRGEMNELRRETAEKNCKFVPGAAPPGAPVGRGPAR
ncbi:MAG: hypothetical protein K9G60_07685 [Pseudolabrys sp.]|nr:hypothetical protein [Pseudolabrys sp.]